LKKVTGKVLPDPTGAIEIANTFPFLY